MPSLLQLQHKEDFTPNVRRILEECLYLPDEEKLNKIVDLFTWKYTILGPRGISTLTGIPCASIKITLMSGQYLRSIWWQFPHGGTRQLMCFIACDYNRVKISFTRLDSPTYGNIFLTRAYCWAHGLLQFPGSKADR